MSPEASWHSTKGEHARLGLSSASYKVTSSQTHLQIPSVEGLGLTFIPRKGVHSDHSCVKPQPSSFFQFPGSWATFPGSQAGLGAPHPVTLSLQPLGLLPHDLFLFGSESVSVRGTPSIFSPELSRVSGCRSLCSHTPLEM